MKIIRKIILASLILSGISTEITYAAGNLTTTNKATATISSSCRITAIDIAVGDLTAAPSIVTTYGTGNLNVTCSKGISYQLNMSNGNNYANGTPNMKGAVSGQIISYCIRSTTASIENSCTTSYWGPDASHSVSGNGTGATQAIPIYAITKKGFYTPDNYSDLMVTTISF